MPTGTDNTVFAEPPCTAERASNLESELERLRGSEARLRALLGCGIPGITLVDAQGLVLFDAPLLRDNLGYRPEELMGHNVLDLVVPAQRQRAARELAQLAASPLGSSCELELELQAKDGSVRLFQVLGTNRLADPLLGGLVINTLEITERILATEAVRQREEWLRPLSDANLIGILTTRQQVEQELERQVQARTLALRESQERFRQLAGIAEEVRLSKNLDQEILRATHREQQRIGRDLHDGICQLLIGAELTAGMLQRRLAKRKAPEAADLQYLQGVLKEAISQTREVTRGLIPSQLQTGGLPLVLDNLAESIPSLFQIPCTFRCGRRVKIHNTMAVLHLYRIAQEAVHNAARHAKPKHIEIRLSQHQGVISLVIADDGCGIRNLRTPRKSGFGLQIMRHRARMVGASLVIEPGSGGGTVVTCVYRNRKPTKTALSSR